MRLDTRYITLVELMYFVITRMPGESGGVYVPCIFLASQVSYSRRLRSFLLCLWDVFRALINPALATDSIRVIVIAGHSRLSEFVLTVTRV